jgi:hypothetical protein
MFGMCAPLQYCAGVLVQQHAASVERQPGGRGKKNAFLEQFMYKNDHFTKTGSGQT